MHGRLGENAASDDLGCLHGRSSLTLRLSLAAQSALLQPETVQLHNQPNAVARGAGISLGRPSRVPYVAYASPSAGPPALVPAHDRSAHLPDARIRLFRVPWRLTTE